MNRGSETIQNHEIHTQALKAWRELFSVCHLEKKIAIFMLKNLLYRLYSSNSTLQQAGSSSNSSVSLVLITKTPKILLSASLITKKKFKKTRQKLLKSRVFLLAHLFQSMFNLSALSRCFGKLGDITEKLRHWFKISSALKSIRSHPQVRQSSGGSTSLQQHRNIRASAAAYPSFPKDLRLILRCNERKNHSDVSSQLRPSPNIFLWHSFSGQCRKLQWSSTVPWK